MALDRPLHRRVHGRRIPRSGRAAGARPTRSRCCGRARSSCRPKSDVIDRLLPEICAAAGAGDQRRRLELRARGRAADAARSAEDPRARRVRARGPDAAVQAAGGLVAYLRETQKADLAHVRPSATETRADCLIIDPITLKHLEVVTGSEGGAQGSLLHEIDRTVTSMGGRLLRAWLLRPLCALERIRDRLDAVEELAFRSTERGKFRETLKTVHDLERLVARAALGTAGPRDLVSLRQSLAAVPRVKLVLARRAGAAPAQPARRARRPRRRPRPHRAHARRRAAGARARRRIHARRHRCRARRAARPISRSGRQVIAEMEERERARTGIARSRFASTACSATTSRSRSRTCTPCPADYQRKQTIAGGERFTTPALKEYEEKVLGADERILERELEIFEELRTRVAAEAPRIQDTARALATLDVLAAWPRPPRSPTTRSRTCTTATSSSSPTPAIRSSSATRRTRSCPTTSTSTARRGSW